MLVFVKTKIYSKVIQGLGLALCLPPLTATVKKRRIFNRCDQVYLQTLKHGQEIYTDSRGININRMMLIGQMMWIVTPGKE